MLRRLMVSTNDRFKKSSMWGDAAAPEVAIADAVVNVP
jgi:hypothetical protein